MTTYYQFIPIWKDNSRPQYIEGWGRSRFVGDTSIVHTKFNSIEDGLEAAKLDGTALREKNWEVLKCDKGFFFTTRTRIMFRTLYNQGYLSNEVKSDSVSEYYLHKK